MKFYHGTTTAIEIGNKLLPPSKTSMIRETWREHKDKVYVTLSRKSAEKYAKKAAAAFGGAPVVYQVLPVHAHQVHDIEYICDYAFVLNKF